MKLNKNIVVILGYKLGKNNKISNILEKRLERALKESDATFIVVGGKLSENLRTEADIMREWLIEHGISKNDIIMESYSKDTIENIKYLKPLLEKYNIKKIKLITSQWHVPRTKKIIQLLLPNIDVSFIKTTGGNTQNRRKLEKKYTRKFKKNYL